MIYLIISHCNFKNKLKLPLLLRSTPKKNVNVPSNSKYRPKDCLVKQKYVAKLCIID